MCHIQHNTRRLCWPLLLSFSIILPSGVIKASTVRQSPRAHLHVLGMLRLMPWHKPTEFVHSFLFRSCVCFYLYDPFNCISFLTLSRQFSAFSLCSSGFMSALLVPSTIDLFMKVFLSPYIILCGRLGIKHQLNSVFGRLDEKKYRIKHFFQLFKLCSLQNTVFMLIQYYSFMITDQICQRDWAFVWILNSMSGEPMSGGFLLKISRLAFIKS